MMDRGWNLGRALAGVLGGMAVWGLVCGLVVLGGCSSPDYGGGAVITQAGARPVGGYGSPETGYYTAEPGYGSEGAGGAGGGVNSGTGVGYGNGYSANAGGVGGGAVPAGVNPAGMNPSGMNAAGAMPERGYNGELAGGSMSGSSPQVYYIHDPLNPRANSDGYVAQYVSRGSGAEQRSTVRSDYGQAVLTDGSRGTNPGNSGYAGYANNSQAAGGYEQQSGNRAAAGQEAGLGQLPSVRGGQPVVGGVSVTELGTPTAPAAAEYAAARGAGTPAVTGAAAGGSNRAGYAGPSESGQGNPPAMGGGSEGVGVLASGDGAQRASDIAGQGAARAARQAMPAVKETDLEQTVAGSRVEPAVSERGAVRTKAALGIEDAVTVLEERVRQNPEDMEAKLALHHLYSLAHKNAEAEGVLSGVGSEQQSQQLAEATKLLMEAYSREKQNDPEAANRALAALERMREQLLESADLEITNLKICSKVDGFGRYVEIAASELESGAARTFLVYCELRNFQSQPTGEGQYITRLNSEITLYDADGRVVQQRRDDVTDVPSYNKRRDFFLRGPLNVPRLAPGKYCLEVKMTDKVAGKIAIPQRVDFEVK